MIQTEDKELFNSSAVDLEDIGLELTDDLKDVLIDPKNENNHDEEMNSVDENKNTMEQLNTENNETEKETHQRQ